MNLERVGRDGYLGLRFQHSGGRTILGKSRFTLPLQVLAPLAADHGSAYLMLLNPTGGVLGGDHLATEICLEDETHAVLTTPSATRVYKAAHRPAVLETAITVGKAATLEYVPDHVIPHAGCALRQSLRIEMAPRSRAIVMDSMASGRLAHGERWRFTELDSRIDVRISGQPVFFNRTKIIPDAQRPDRIGLMEEFDYLGCIAVFADAFPDWQPAAEAINNQLQEAPEIYGGVSLLARRGCVVRYMARKASDLTRINKKLWDTAREAVLNLPAFDARKY